MTREEWAKLTDEEKLRIMAKHCKLAVAEHGLAGVLGHTLDGKTWESFPNWFNDLNAIQEAVMAMPFMQQTEWAKWMWRICRTSQGQYPTYYGDFQAMSGTAAQRVEAFVLTLEEDE